LQRSAIGNQRTIRQADTQRVTNLCTLAGERIVIILFDAARYCYARFRGPNFR
jgi:hypothetical protein